MYMAIVLLLYSIISICYIWLQVCTFINNLLFIKQKFYTITGSHTIAVVKGEESYDLLRSSFADVFKTINGIIETGKVCVNGLDVPVEFSLGGDHKV